MMDSDIRVYGVTVNHNTSHFVELMVRTLLLKNSPPSIDFTLTVLDNSSNDEHLPALRSYLIDHGITLEQTGFDTAIAVEKHGAALESFVMQHPDCTHYLFLDADMWFIESNTISTMLSELDEADPSVFANQARIAGYYAGRIIEGHNGLPGAGDAERYPTWQTLIGGQQYITSTTKRCSPVCSLFKNTPVFRSTVAALGLTPTIRLHVGTAVYYDTFGLMTHTMLANQQRFIVSSHAVNHFTETTYQPERRAPKDRDCLFMLEELRADRGMKHSRFYESEWVSQQR